LSSIRVCYRFSRFELYALPLFSVSVPKYCYSVSRVLFAFLGCVVHAGPCHRSGGYALPSYSGTSNSVRCNSTCHPSWVKCHWSRFFSGLPLLIRSLALPHNHLSLLPEVWHSSDPTAHYHNLVLQLWGFIPDAAFVWLQRKDISTICEETNQSKQGHNIYTKFHKKM
jgi:hypothetical protein